MSVPLRQSGFAASSRFRTLLLIWALCAAVICPAAWQSLTTTLRATDAAHGAGAFGSATLAPTDWMWESLGLDGRQSALSDGRISPALSAARLVPTDNAPSAVPVGLTPRLAPCLVLPEPELAPAAWACVDPTPRLPATRGLFCRPPPSLKA